MPPADHESARGIRSAPPTLHEWFERHTAAYYSELLAVRALLPRRGLGLSIGVGTGRFAASLGVQIGIDPADGVLSYAAGRGVSALRAVGEALPFVSGAFDHALFVATICFVDDVAMMLSEAHRVLKPGGALVIGFIDRDSQLGRHYLAHQEENVFYRDATFYSADEVEQCLRAAGFSGAEWVQTLSRPLERINEIERVRTGRGGGAFVVLKAFRSQHAAGMVVAVTIVLSK